MPAERPFTIPVVAPTGAVPEALLAHLRANTPERAAVPVADDDGQIHVEW